MNGLCVDFVLRLIFSFPKLPKIAGKFREFRKNVGLTKPWQSNVSVCVFIGITQ